MSNIAARLLADLLNPASTPAKAANPAKNRASIGFAGDFTPCEGLRISANPQPAADPFAPDSQKFAGDSQTPNRAQSERPCGFSQNSQDSQGVDRANASAESARTCSDCRHRLHYGTCGEPVAAGLAPTFGVHWPPTGHAASCAAFAGKEAPPKAPDRPYRLSKDEGGAAHADPWDDAAIARFVARVGLLLRRGYSVGDADDLAERLHLRDVQADDRRLCIECVHLTGRAGARVCGNHRRADMPRELAGEFVTLLQRCGGFDAPL